MQSKVKGIEDFGGEGKRLQAFKRSHGKFIIQNLVTGKQMHSNKLLRRI